jgi:hypothetical protein
MDFASPQRLKRVGNSTARFRCVFFSTHGYGVRKNCVSFSYVSLGEVGSTFGKICFVFDSILHTAYTADACALISILPALSLIDMTYFTVVTKATPASYYRIIWISLVQNVMKCVHYGTARFRCVFGSTDGPVNVLFIRLIFFWAYLLSS